MLRLRQLNLVSLVLDNRYSQWLPADPVFCLPVKRRFVRQNREIARANSLQSVRVKDLEAEVSRLLAENVSLREEVISLKQELESFQGSERVDAGVSCIKDKLEAKLAEISSIVTDLGTLPRRRPAAVPSRSLPDNPDQPVSPTDNHAMPAVRATRDPPFGSDLPVILEDKLYPRLSLECVITSWP